MAYQPINDPVFKWGSAYTRTWAPYDSKHALPRRVSLFENSPSAKRIINESSGGFREYIAQSEYFEAAIAMKILDEDATHHIYSLLAWANQGNAFRFCFDRSFYGAIGNVTVDCGPGSLYIYHDGTFPLGNYEVIVFNHLGQYDKVWGIEAVPGEFLVYAGNSELSYDYTAGLSVMKYAYYYHKAEAINPSGSLTLNPGRTLYQFSLSFRELLDVGMLG